MHQYKAEAESRAVNVKPTELPDAHLVQMAQRDPAAFVHLYERHVDAIYRYCSMRLNGAAAEDATSITFLNALKAIGRFDTSRAGFRPWLYSIAHNAVVDQLRVCSHVPIETVEVEDHARSLDDHVVAIDQRRQIERAIHHLPPDQQQVIHLRLAALSGQEIADAMGRSHVAVRALQHRAIRNLRSLIHPSIRDGLDHD